MIALLYNLQIRILISGTSSGWGGITKFRQIFSDFDCECAQAFNFVPFFQLLIYTIGRRLKLRKTKTCPQQDFVYSCCCCCFGSNLTLLWTLLGNSQGRISLCKQSSSSQILAVKGSAGQTVRVPAKRQELESFTRKMWKQKARDET